MLAYGFSQRAAWAQGQPISQLMAEALARPDLISLAAGFVDQATLPISPMKTAINSLMADPTRASSALQYGTTIGHAELRQSMIDQLELSPDAPRPDSDQVIITAGSNQFLHLVCESLLDPGDIVLCAAPTYLVFLGTLGNLGARSIGVYADDEGIVPDALTQTLADLERDGELARVKAIYVVPYFDNPRGVSMPLERRVEVVEIAKRWSHHHTIQVIEDAAYRLLRYEGEDIPSLWTVDDSHDTVIVAGTFSKSFSPGLRIGWGVLPRHLIAPVSDLKGNIDFGSPNFSQHVMNEILTQGLFSDHVEYLRVKYREKLQCMILAAEREFAKFTSVTWEIPKGGLYVWVKLPESCPAGPEGALQRAAIEQGVIYVPGEYCFPAEGEPVQHNTMRLSFGVPSTEEIDRGMAALARAIETVAEV